MLGKCLGAAALIAALFVGAKAEDADFMPKVDMNAWKYQEEADVWYQTGISYCKLPADPDIETMGFFVPGAYMMGTDNGDGTWSCEISADGALAGYTAETAPVIVPVNTPGYSAMAAPEGFDGSYSEFLSAGFVVAAAGCRGREDGAPAGVTDLKAAIRYARYNAGHIPGNMERIFSEGMSGGGAQSALLGATGDAPEYMPYLLAIGAVQSVSDAVLGSMDWCPITNLDTADAAYEWNMGVTRSGLSESEQKLSDGLAAAYGPALNAMGLVDAEGNGLLLEQSADGRYQSGSYYEYVKRAVETSLEHFLEDTVFPYDTSAASSGRGGMRLGRPGGMPGGNEEGFPGGRPLGENGANDFANTDFAQMDNILRGAANSAAVTLNGTYDTAEAYIKALNAPFEWVSYDASAGRATITSLADFSRAMKAASKNLGAFDDLDCSQGENVLFGDGDGQGKHFDSMLAELLSGEEKEAFTADLARVDAMGSTVAQRLAMYTPLNYLLPSQEGYGTAQIAQYWRIRTGINQGDTALCTEINLALAADAYSESTQVDFEMIWGQGHTQAERTGTANSNFVQWVNDCLTVAAMPE